LDRVSIHAPAKGATNEEIKTLIPIFCFNPRAREGRDCLPKKKIKGGNSFNPRAREGRDSRQTAIIMFVSRFNPRAREGRDIPES